MFIIRTTPRPARRNLVIRFAPLSGASLIMGVIMYRQRATKQGIILVLSVLMLGLFVFVTYFYWVPDTLISFVPDNVLFYSHLNLNKLHCSGYLARKWFRLNDDKIENIFKEYPINPDVINSLEEIALFALPEGDLGFSQFGLIFKSKMSLEDLQDQLLPSYSIRQISDKIFIASSQINLDGLENFIPFSKENRFRFINPFNKKPSLAHGYVNLESKFVRFNILYSSSRENKLFFEIENKNSSDYPLFGFEQDNFSILGNTFDFVFIFPRQESVDELKNRIKVYLASQRPKEREVVLPDNSSFIELVVDPQDFVFKKEGMVDYWQNSFDQNFEIALFQDQKYTFFSNNHILLKKIISIEQEEDLISALYWEIDNPWLQRLVLKEKDQKVKGFLELK